LSDCLDALNRDVTDPDFTRRGFSNSTKVASTTAVSSVAEPLEAIEVERDLCPGASCTLMSKVSRARGDRVDLADDAALRFGDPARDADADADAASS
jgi:hypothetical protein